MGTEKKPGTFSESWLAAYRRCCVAPDDCFGSTAPETIGARGKAFDRARHSLHDIGKPDLVREIIAKRIVEVARDGERDPDELCVRALKALGFSSFCNRQIV
jgi:hypothetical protein